MAEQVLKNVGIWIEGYSFAGVSNSLTIEPTLETPESTTFDSGDWREYAEGGLKGVSFSLEGFFDERDEQQFESLGQERSVMCVPAGQMPGDVALVIPVRVSGHALSGSVGELLAFTYAGEGDGETVRAQVFDVREGVTAVVTTARLQLGAVASGQTLEAWVHLDFTAGLTDVELFSADAAAAGTIANRGTVSAAQATGLYRLTVPGPVTDEYWYIMYDAAAADFDAAVAVAIG